MAELGPEIVDAVRAACEAGSREIAGSLLRAFDGLPQVAVGDAGTCGPSSLPIDCDGPALLVLFDVGQQAMALILTHASGLAPDWCKSPSAEAGDKLSTLARELSGLCLPKTVVSDRQRAVWVADATAALSAAGLAERAAMLPLSIVSEAGQPATAYLVWPLANSAAITPGMSAKNAAETTVAVSDSSSSNSDSRGSVRPPNPSSSVQPAASRHFASSPDELPTYTRSLLKIRVPVGVTLAKKKQPLGRILEMGAGSIIHFDKKCEEMLDLEVNGRPIAQGEPVKVGDKFGLRVTSVTLPPEQFKPVTSRRS